MRLRLLPCLLCYASARQCAPFRLHLVSTAAPCCCSTPPGHVLREGRQPGGRVPRPGPGRLAHLHLRPGAIRGARAGRVGSGAPGGHDTWRTRVGWHGNGCTTCYNFKDGIGWLGMVCGRRVAGWWRWDVQQECGALGIAMVMTRPGSLRCAHKRRCRKALGSWRRQPHACALNSFSVEVRSGNEPTATDGSALVSTLQGERYGHCRTVWPAAGAGGAAGA